MKKDEGFKEQQYIQRVQNLLSLTEQNQKLAAQYLDLSAPEQPALLQKAAHQNFMKLESTVRYQLYDLLRELKKSNEALAVRMIRLVAEIGGETAQEILLYYSSWVYYDEFEYIRQYLTKEQAAVILANAIAWQKGEFYGGYTRQLVEMGMEDPEIFCRMRSLCYNDEGNNTKMLLAALYFRCVKPLVTPSEPDLSAQQAEDIKPLDCPAAHADDKKEGNPAHIREMTAYLLQSLMQRTGELFHEDSMPQASELETVQKFVFNAAVKEPIPDEIRTILSGKSRQNAFELSFQSYLAFLAIDHSDRFWLVLRIAELLDGMTAQNLPLSSCLCAGQDWFDRHILALETILELPGDRYIYWAVAKMQTTVLERMAAKAPKVFCTVYGNCSVDDKGYLLDCIKAGNPKYFQLKKTFLVDAYRRAAVEEIVKGYPVFQKEAERYLLGELEISAILSCVERWRKMSGIPSTAPIHSAMICGEKQIYQRALVLECLQLNCVYYCDYWIDAKLDQTERDTECKYKDVRQVRSLLAVFAEEKVPPQYQIEFLGNVYYGYKADDQGCLEAIALYHKDWHNEWVAAAQSSFLPARVLAICVMGVQWQEFQEELLACASENSKQGQEELRKICIAHPDFEPRILDLLQSMRSAQRRLAVEVLDGWGAEKYREALAKALASEKTKKIRTLIQTVQTKLPPETTPIQTQSAAEPSVERLIQDILFGAWKRKLSWLPLDTFPQVHQTEGELASKEQLAAMLVSYADMKELGLSKEAQIIAAQLNPAETAAYIKEVYRFWLSEGAPAKRKWVLYAAAIHGDEAVVAEIYAQLQSWAQHSRGAMASEAVKALALSDVPTALLLVDQISRRFKYRPVKLAAAQALDNAAAQFEISKEELEDRIVPDLGFDDQMERIFDYGKRKFKAVLTSSLTLEVYDEKGKLLKNMPAPGKKDDPSQAKAANDAWKLLKKQFNTVIENQKLRLEYTWSTGREWEPAKWQDVFVRNPVMRPFAVELIWGIYEDNRLTTTFRYMEDGTFNTAEEEEYVLPADGRIALVHPLELSQEVLDKWQKQLIDYEIEQPVEQLGRPVYRVTDEEKEETQLTRFGGMVLNALSLAEKLQNMGWYRGEANDIGIVDSYYRMDGDRKVKLNFSGDDIIPIDENVVVYDVCFYAHAHSDENCVPCILGAVPPRYFSEIVLQLAKATVSSTETRPYPLF